MLVTLDGTNFKLILEQNELVLVDFGATWCYPCRQMIPVIEALAKENPNVVIGKVEVSTDEELAEEFGVTNLPAFLLFKDRRVVDQLIGPNSKHRLEEMLAPYLSIN